MSDHSIPDEIRNSSLQICINEYVRNIAHRNMLRDKWFNGMSIDAIAEKYDITATTVKRIIYDEGDRVLLLAARYQRTGTLKEPLLKRLLKLF